MQSTVPESAAATPDLPSLPVTPESLAAAFHGVRDPRRQASVTYPLAAILTLAVVAILANQTSVLAIAAWGARQSRDFLARLGLPARRTPCQSTLQRLCATRDGDALAAVLAEHFAATAAMEDLTALQGVAIDGQAQRGRLRFDPGGGVVHALSAFCHEMGIVLAQEPIEDRDGKVEAELTVAPALLDRVAGPGRVITGDALFCQRHRCQQIVDADGDYLFVVRANQPALLEAIQLLFDPPPTPSLLPLVDRRAARLVEHGHGRHDEIRQLVASTDLTAYLADELAWPGVAQGFRLTQTWRAHGQAKQQLLYGSTSLPPERGPAARLLALKRGHWQIENQLHRTKDVTLGEDQSLIHVGQGPTVIAQLRDTAISLLHRAGIRRITARLREYSQFPERAAALVLETPMTHA